MAEVQALPMLYVSGTHYNVGFSIGRTFGENIKSFWKESLDVNKIDIPFHKTAEGKAFFNSSLDVCQKNFPDFLQEIQGMADGSGVSFNDLFILNISKEVHNVLSQDSLKEKKAMETAGCTDVIVNSPTCKIIGHNEDCDPAIQPYGYLVSARILDEGGKEMESFTAYCYPGVLAGTTLSFNKHGMVFTIDGLYTDYIASGAPPRVFLNRSIIRAQTFEEALDLIRNKGFGVAYGFTVNMADVKRPADIWSIEVGPGANESVFHVHTVPEVTDPSMPCHYIHINSFKHLQLSEIPNLTSSIIRTKSAEAFPPPKNRQDILRILGDQSNSEKPIFRTDRPSDHSATVFTGIADIANNRVDIYRGNPAHEGSVPLMHFTILDK